MAYSASYLDATPAQSLVYNADAARSIGYAPTLLSAAPAASYIDAAPAQSIAYSTAYAPSYVSAVPAPALAPAPSFVSVAPAPSLRSVASASAPTPLLAVAPALAPTLRSVAPLPSVEPPLVPAAVPENWADFSPEPVRLEFPPLPDIDYGCYQLPSVPPGSTRFLKVEEPTGLRNLEQNFNDVKTAVRENNTHIQRNKTNITNIQRNHNHLLRIVTNENNFEHNLTNKVVRVADVHRQKVENVPGEVRNFKDYKQTQRVEAQGCRRADTTLVAAAATPSARTSAPAPPIVPVAPALAPLSMARTAYSAYLPAANYALPVPSFAAAPGNYTVIAPPQRNPAVFL